MDRLTELELFVQTAEMGTLSKAAEALEISNAAASRHLAALEQRLNVRLIERNTRRLALTHVGNQFYERCKILLAELREAEAAVNASLVEPEGTLNITASISFAKLHLAPLVSEFRRKYPKIKIKIHGANRYYDIMDSGIDIAIRTKEFEPDSNITIRRLAETRRILAASREYLERRGKPKSVEDLLNHDILIYNHANEPRKLRFTRGDEESAIKIDPVLESNDGQILCAAAKAGAGILIQPMYIIYDDVVSGALVPVLSDWDLPRLTINIAFQERRYMPARTRLFIDFLVEKFHRKEYERYWCR
ncbi:LysR family transcriptional regulator [Azotobacter salinestris]|uniref:LysR family transcriptional regulator n=1 Tax=Azotobacter salinestris TaxID=69964 RepID=UPI0032DF5F3C